jgi:hypothetical protein
VGQNGSPAKAKSRKEFFFAILPVFGGIWLYLAIFADIFSSKTGGYGDSIRIHLAHSFIGAWNRHDGLTPPARFPSTAQFSKNKAPKRPTKAA